MNEDIIYRNRIIQIAIIINNRYNDYDDSTKHILTNNVMLATQNDSLQMSMLNAMCLNYY